MAIRVRLSFVLAILAILRSDLADAQDRPVTGDPTKATPPAAAAAEQARGERAAPVASEEEVVVPPVEARSVKLAAKKVATADVPSKPSARTGGRAKKKAPDVPPTLQKTWMDKLQWRSIGPATMGGRITALAVYEADSTLWWAATASGGLLKTTNDGRTFEHQFDRESTVSIGDVQVAQSNKDIVWIGTGEANPRNSASWGDGVYKSIDGGKTWKNMGLKKSYQIGRIAIHPTNPDIVYVGALGRLWGPNEERGLYKTNDGGEHWERILYVDENTGVIDVNLSPADADTLLVATYERRRDGFDGNDPMTRFGAGAAMYKSIDAGATFRKVTQGLPTCNLGRMDIEYYRKDPTIVYAVVESEKIGKQPREAAYLGIQAEDADVGARLTEITKDGPAEKSGLRKGDIVIGFDGETVQSYADFQRRIRGHLAGEKVSIEVSRDRKSQTFDITFALNPAVLEEEAKEDPESEESDNADAEGQAEPSERGGGRGGRGGRGTGGGRAPRSPFQGSLGGQLQNVQDQQGPDGHEYGGTFRSEDGGETWTRINSLNIRPMYFSHLRVDPSDNQYIYSAGVSLYRSKDGGATFTSDGHNNDVHVDHHAMWIDPSDGRRIILGNDGGIYVTRDRMENWDHLNHVAIGQFYDVGVGPRRNYMVYGGLQDNGSWGAPSRTRSDGGTRNEDWISVGGGDGFVCRVSPDDPDLLYTESQNGSMSWRNLRTGERGSIRPRPPKGVTYRFNWKTPFTLSNHNADVFYTAGNYVFRSLYRGRDLKAISPEITPTDKGAGSAIAESPRDSDRLWAGTTDGGLWRTLDGGHTWTDLWDYTPEVKAATPDKPVDPNDIVSGEWKGQTTNERFPDANSDFGLSLKRGKDGMVSGSIDSRITSGDIENARFDEATRTLTFSFGEEPRTMDATGTLDADGAMSGTLSAAGGNFSMQFSATRGGGEDKGAGAPGEFQPLRDLVPGRMWVSTLEASRHEDGRVYLCLDGHRSDNDDPWIFVSEDSGGMWKPLHTNLPEGSGSTRTLREDIKNKDVLYLGCEFRSFVSIDRGVTWTSLHSNLPTVAVHEFAQHETAGEIVAATHGRSLWILEVTALRQMTKEALDENTWLYKPNDVVYLDRAPSHGGTIRRFLGENPSELARIHYHLKKKPRSISLEVQDLSGEKLADLEVSDEPGFHSVYWNLRGSGSRRSRAAPGTYRLALKVDNQILTETFEVLADPERPEIVLWGEAFDERQDLDRILDGGDEDEDEDAGVDRFDF